MRPAVNKVSAAQLRDELGARFSAPLMSFFLRRLKDRSQAEDLTPEGLLRVIRACGGAADVEPRQLQLKNAGETLPGPTPRDDRARPPPLPPAPGGASAAPPRRLVGGR